MARFDKLSVIEKMANAPIIPVFYHNNADVVKHVVKACYDGGVSVFEFTNRGDHAHEVFNEVIKYAERECQGMSVGVGSVVDAPTAALYMQLGASFVVSPLLNLEVARCCNRRQIPYIPGCGTVSEVSAAQEVGCEICKVFPGDVLTPQFVKSLMAPMPWSRLMVTGGVSPTQESLHEWFKAGAFCVGMGSKLIINDCIASSDWAYITSKCREALAHCRD